MTRRILVPLDGSPEGEVAFAEAMRIASPDSEVHLLHVVPIPTPPVGMEPTLLLDAPEQARPYLESVRRRFPESRGLDIPRAGDPAPGILALALELNVDLIAMCTHARTGLPRWILGSVAQEVVRRSRLPVLLTRPGRPPAPPRLRKILVALDGTEFSEAILDAVRPLAARTGAEVVLLHVEDSVRDPAPQWALQGPLSLRERPEHRYQSLADGLEVSGLIAYPVIGRGQPAAEIVRQARDLGADLIAMSTHARAGLERTLLGSVAEAVLREAGVPLLLHRPPRKETYRTTTGGNHE